MATISWTINYNDNDERKIMKKIKQSNFRIMEIIINRINGLHLEKKNKLANQ